MAFLVTVAPSAINLQATLSAGSAESIPQPAPHHPITCTSTLLLHEDGTLECEHARVRPGDSRTQACINASVAILLIELLIQREAADGP